MRSLPVRLHRWFGLAAALFLFVAGATGAVISWDHELDEWLNPHLFHAATPGQPQSAYALAQAVEVADPRVRVRFMPLEIEPGHSFTVSVEPRVDPSTGKLFEPGYNQVAVDPVTGAVQGKRMWGEVSLSRENLLPFLYKLHYSMHIPDGAGIRWGIWLMGLMALGWAVDCLVALWLSFPNPAQWRKSFAFRWRQGGYKLAFDLHRSGGVWLWLLLLILAVTSVSMNLEREVVRPLVAALSPLSPSPFASRTAVAPEQAREPRLTMAEAVTLAEAEARRLGWERPAGGVFAAPEFGVMGVGFFAPGNSHGDGGLGNPWLYFDAEDGSLVGHQVPGEGSAGDIFLQAQFPLHSGRILGLPGRILVSLLGAAVATLCVTGLIVWLKKRRARAGKAARRAGEPSPESARGGDGALAGERRGAESRGQPETEAA